MEKKCPENERVSGHFWSKWRIFVILKRKGIWSLRPAAGEIFGALRKETKEEGIKNAIILFRDTCFQKNVSNSNKFSSKKTNIVKI